MPLIRPEQWKCCHRGGKVPAFYHSSPTQQDNVWWEGLRLRLKPLVEQGCTVYGSKDKISWEQWLTGDGLPANLADSKLKTQCLVLAHSETWLAKFDEHPFRLQPHGQKTDRRSPNRGYIKVKANGFSTTQPSTQDKSFYVHTLLCYMFHGPKRGAKQVAGHMCHHKLCILPWHLKWISQSDNIKMGRKRQKKKWK